MSGFNWQAWEEDGCPDYYDNDGIPRHYGNIDWEAEIAAMNVWYETHGDDNEPMPYFDCESESDVWYETHKGDPRPPGELPPF